MAEQVNITSSKDTTIVNAELMPIGSSNLDLPPCQIGNWSDEVDVEQEKTRYEMVAARTVRQFRNALGPDSFAISRVDYQRQLYYEAHDSLLASRGSGNNSGKTMSLTYSFYSVPIMINFNLDVMIANITLAQAVKNLMDPNIVGFGMNHAFISFIMTCGPKQSVMEDHARVCTKDLFKSHCYICIISACYDAFIKYNQSKKVSHKRVAEIGFSNDSLVLTMVIAYGKSFSAKPISVIPKFNKSEHKGKSQFLYVPKYVLSSFITQCVGATSEYATIPSGSSGKIQNWSFKSNNRISDDEMAYKLMLASAANIAKFSNVLIAKVSVCDFRYNCNFPRLLQLDCNNAANGIGGMAFVSDTVYDILPQIRCELETLPILKIYVDGVKGVVYQDLYNNLLQHIVYFYTELCISDSSNQHLRELFLHVPTVLSFLREGSFKVIGTSTGIGLVQVDVNRLSSPKYFNFMSSGEKYSNVKVVDHFSLVSLFNPTLLEFLNRAVIKYVNGIVSEKSIGMLSWSIECYNTNIVKIIPGVRFSPSHVHGLTSDFISLDFSRLGDIESMSRMFEESALDEVLSRNIDANIDLSKYSGHNCYNFLDYTTAVVRIRNSLRANNNDGGAHSYKGKRNEHSRGLTNVLHKSNWASPQPHSSATGSDGRVPSVSHANSGYIMNYHASNHNYINSSSDKLAVLDLNEFPKINAHSSKSRSLADFLPVNKPRSQTIEDDPLLVTPNSNIVFTKKVRGKKTADAHPKTKHALSKQPSKI